MQVILHAPAAELRRRIYAGEGIISEEGAERCRWRTGTHALESIAVHLGALGVDFEVLEPPELVAVVDALGARLRRAAKVSAGSKKARR